MPDFAADDFAAIRARIAQLEGERLLNAHVLTELDRLGLTLCEYEAKIERQMAEIAASTAQLNGGG